MNSIPISAVPRNGLVAALFALLLAGCASNAGQEPPPAPPSKPRELAVADMRARAAATDDSEFPDVFAARSGPPLESLHSVSEVEEIEAQLSAIAASRTGTDAGDAAAATRRAELLRQLAEARRTEAEEAIASGSTLQ